MRIPSRGRSTLLTVLAAAVVLVVAGGGGAVAGSLVTSAKIKNNTIQSIDVHNGSLTGADIKDRSLTNNDVDIYFATVTADGTVIDQSGGVTVTKQTPIGPGRYGVKFPRDVTRCADVATIGDPEDASETGQVNVADLSGVPHGVYVNTRDEAGTVSTDHSFHLVVVC